LKISFVGIQNFRKLKSTKIEFSNKTTVFVGANNSGKTTAIVALKKFLKIKKLTLNDFTISNQSIINKIGKNYIENGETSEVDITLWQSILPSLDLWLDIEDNELYYVPELIPNLQWEGPKVGVRFVYEPVNLNSFLILYSSYYLKVNRNKKLKELNLWPSNLCDFLDKKIESTFEMHSYILDYRKIQASENDVYNPEILDEGVEPLPFEPLKKIIKLDIISAQRGLDDTDTKEKSTNTSYNLLSNQLRNYYDSQLDIKQELPDSDIETLKDLHSAEATFSKQIASKFQKPMEELAEFGYPGKYNPEIII
jgi:predicted ATP-dependent endonuclease of OLD family